jgi:hypothetical protein
MGRIDENGNYIPDEETIKLIAKKQKFHIRMEHYLKLFHETNQKLTDICKRISSENEAFKTSMINDRLDEIPGHFNVVDGLLNDCKRIVIEAVSQKVEVEVDDSIVFILRYIEAEEEKKGE